MSTKINTPEEARAIADKIVTLLQQVSQLDAAKEAEKNAVDTKYATLKEPIEKEAKELQKAFQNFLKKKGSQEALFDEGNRSGHSTLATFGYRDSAPTLKAMNGTLTAVADKLYKEGDHRFLTIDETVKVELNQPALKAANLKTGALADLGLMWSTTTKFFIELTNKAITPAKRAKA